MRLIGKSGAINEFFYLWDPKLGIGSAYGLGAFQTFSLSGANYVVTPGTGSYGPAGSINNFIQSGSAFFKDNPGATAGNISFDENCKSANSVLVNRPNGVAEVPTELRTNLYGINADGSAFSDRWCTE